MYTKTISLTTIVVATMLSLAVPALAQMDTPRSSSAPAPLAFDVVNSLFQEDYDEAKKVLLANSGHIIVCKSGVLSLYRNGALKESIPFITPAYTGLKEVAHVPLAAYLILITKIDERKPKKLCLLDAETVSRLRGLQLAVQSATRKMSESGIPQQSFERQQQIIERTDAFLGAALTQRQISYEQLNAFTRGITKLEMQNTDEAADWQISSMGRIAAKWKDSMSSDDWSKTSVVVVSGHMPRAQSSSAQFFANLLHEEREGGRLIIIETAAEEADALDSWATHWLDAKIGVDFFGDPWRMHRDLLSDSIKKSLKKGMQFVGAPGRGK